MKLLNEREAKKDSNFFGALWFIKRVTNYNFWHNKLSHSSQSWSWPPTAHWMEKKKKKCQHSYTYLESWQKAMVQLPFLASCHSVQFSATFRSWIISWVHKWCACQPVTAWILGVLNTATLSMSENSKDFLRQIKVKALRTPLNNNSMKYG